MGGSTADCQLSQKDRAKSHHLLLAAPGVEALQVGKAEVSIQILPVTQGRAYTARAPSQAFYHSGSAQAPAQARAAAAGLWSLGGLAAGLGQCNETQPGLIFRGAPYWTGLWTGCLGEPDRLGQNVQHGPFWHGTGNLGIDHPQGIGLLQDRKIRNRITFGQRLEGFCVDALGLQGIEFSIVHHAPAQGDGVGMDGKAQGFEACCKASQAQQADGVFGKVLIDMAQHPVMQIALSAKGVDQSPIFLITGDGIDGQVTAREILF